MTKYENAVKILKWGKNILEALEEGRLTVVLDFHIDPKISACSGAAIPSLYPEDAGPFLSLDTVNGFIDPDTGIYQMLKAKVVNEIRKAQDEAREEAEEVLGKMRVVIS